VSNLLIIFAKDKNMRFNKWFKACRVQTYFATIQGD